MVGSLRRSSASGRRLPTRSQRPLPDNCWRRSWPMPARTASSLSIPRWRLSRAKSHVLRLSPRRTRIGPSGAPSGGAQRRPPCTRVAPRSGWCSSTLAASALPSSTCAASRGACSIPCGSGHSSCTTQASIWPSSCTGVSSRSRSTARCRLSGCCVAMVERVSKTPLGTTSMSCGTRASRRAIGRPVTSPSRSSITRRTMSSRLGSLRRRFCAISAIG